MNSWGGGGGSRKSSKVIRGDRLNFILFSPKSSPPPPQTINNDRSLRKNYGVRAVARFFVTGSGEGAEGIIALKGGSGGILPPKIWRLQNDIFSTCHELCLRKIDLEYENGKQLQVTIIKIENN